MTVSANIYNPATGQITGHVEASASTIAANVTPERGLFVGALADTATHYIASDPLRIEARPTITPPATTQDTGWVYDLSLLPVGSAVTVRNEVGDELVIMNLSEPLTLVDAGVYALAVAPPFPWVGFDAEVEVSDA
ncbi:MAG: hypothetical protein VR71_10550 [Roseovarius sp. BRH_c41]|uniref:hypothetical protein n=1 Tax=Roseovarius sp. BRH_c41 TaxID=1629709 RepID=UPI0005F147E5|nr:hypothetical protein [Roseovarius sp. BRH_c41]KJS43349.1 MAG: hypothetical protein VR71_10550 [Roseovarius sp. BRH_c41]